MTWMIAIALALAMFLLAAIGLRLPRSGWEPLGAALLLGIAGYGMQASPGLSGAPRQDTQLPSVDAASIVEDRNRLSDRGIPSSNRWIVIADGMARNGQFSNASEVLLGAVEDDPENSEAWLALGNTLVAHADGLLTPAALLAFRKAEETAPRAPGPPLFLGMALAQSGRFAEARSLWSGLLERSADDAPWRAELELQLERLDQLIEAQARAQQIQ